jgi:hypothetical protein
MSHNAPEPAAEDTPGAPVVPEVADDNDPEDRAYPDPEQPALPADRPVGVDSYGTTAQEQLEGEPLDQKLARERPDTPDETVARRARGEEGDEAASTDPDADAASADGVDIREV